MANAQLIHRSLALLPAIGLLIFAFQACGGAGDTEGSSENSENQRGMVPCQPCANDSLPSDEFEGRLHLCSCGTSSVGGEICGTAVECEEGRVVSGHARDTHFVLRFRLDEDRELSDDPSEAVRLAIKMRAEFEEGGREGILGLMSGPICSEPACPSIESFEGPNGESAEDQFVASLLELATDDSTVADFEALFSRWLRYRRCHDFQPSMCEILESTKGPTTREVQTTDFEPRCDDAPRGIEPERKEAQRILYMEASDASLRVFKGPGTNRPRPQDGEESDTTSTDTNYYEKARLAMRNVLLATLYSQLQDLDPDRILKDSGYLAEEEHVYGIQKCYFLSSILFSSQTLIAAFKAFLEFEGNDDAISGSMVDGLEDADEFRNPDGSVNLELGDDLEDYFGITRELSMPN